MVKCWQLDELPNGFNKLERYLKFDRCRLKFDAYWDDRGESAGDIHDLVIFYYLYDDTIQINEIPQFGKPFPLYNRAKLTKKTEDVLKVQTKLNPPLIGYLTMSTIRIKDKCGVAESNIDYYTHKDLKVGETLNVFGRKVVLTNCDQATQDFYRTVYGMKEFDLIERPDGLNSLKTSVEGAKKPNPCGSIEKCEPNCLSTELKVRQQKMKKFLQHDNCKLRFMATIEHDPDRQFIITYFLENDTISVFEVGGRNFSSSGEFLKRARFYLPHKNVTPSSPEPYTSQMLYIGASVEFHRFIFHIIDADEFTLNYMESHACEYPMANIGVIMTKIKAAIEPINDTFLDKYITTKSVIGNEPRMEKIKLDHYTAAMALRELLRNDIIEHEIVSFLRYFDAEKFNSLENATENARSKVQSCVQTTLSNRRWDDFNELKWHFYSVDQIYPNGFMPPDRVLALMRQAKVPLKGNLIDHMFSVLNKDKQGNIEVSDFLNFIDRTKCKPPPTKRISPPDPYIGRDKKSFHHSVRPKEVDWSAFLSKLGLAGKSK